MTSKRVRNSRAGSTPPWKIAYPYPVSPEGVAEWLNNSKAAKARLLWDPGEFDDRITELKQAIREATAYERIANLVRAFRYAERELSDYSKRDDPDVTVGFLQELWIDRINLILECYNVTPFCVTGPPSLRRWWIQWIPAGLEVVGQAWGLARARVGPEEMEVLQQVCTMATEGTLGYLAVCHCGRWYVRRRFDQRFCTLKCKTHSEPFKAGRREYMRDYYQKYLSKKKHQSARKEKAYGKKW